MTKEITTVAVSVADALINAESSVKLDSNKAIRQHMAGVAADFLTVKAEAMAAAIAANPDLDLDKESRRASWAPSVWPPKLTPAAMACCPA